MTKEALLEKLKLLEAQRDEHRDIMNQAIGAIGLIQHMLDDALSLDELGEMVGGKVEAIEELYDDKDAA